MSDLAARLRGSHQRTAIDARRLMMPKQNPKCGLLKATIMSGVAPADVARMTYGMKVPEEQSQYALRQGVVFESKLYENGAARIIQALQRVGELAQGEYRILALHEIDGINSTDRRIRRQATNRAVAQTRRAIQMRADGHAEAPHIILQACLRLPLGADAEEAIIRPDVLYATTESCAFKVGEVKSFPELAHLTDEQDVASAASQAGVYQVALEHTMSDLGLDTVMPHEAALLFRRPGYMRAVATMQRIERDVAAARRMLQQRPVSLADVANLIGPGGSLDKAESIERIPTNFTGGCRGFCPMWPVCLARARAAGAPQVLGRKVEDMIVAVGSTTRARELMHGATPANDVEREVQRRLQAGLCELRRATA